MMDAAYSCPSQRLREMQSGSPLDGFSTSMPRLSHTRKYVQVITFDSAMTLHGRCCGTSPHVELTHPPVSSRQVPRPAVRGGGPVGPCSAQHRGPSCFPSPRLRTVRRLHEAPTPSNHTRVVEDEVETAQPASLSLEQTTRWLLWSATPPHLLAELIEAPQDAELILARLREEQRLLERYGDRSLAALPVLTEVRRAQSSSSTTPAAPHTAPRGMRPPRDTGISEGLEGIGVYAGTISAFVKPAAEKTPVSFSGGAGAGGGVLPCEQPSSQAALQAAQAEHMASVAMTGKLPAPSHELRDATRLQGAAPSGTARPAAGPSSLPRRAPPASLDTTQRRPPSSLGGGPAAGAAAGRLPSSPFASSSLPKPASAAAATAAPPPPSPSPSPSSAKAGGRVTADGARVMRTKEATDYYRSLPQNEVSKEEMWRRINEASADRAEETGPAIALTDVDYLKLEEELRDFDTFHYRVGEIAYTDADVRRDYYAMWNLAMSLNKARWSMLEVHSQRGMKTTGAGMKLIFWKESVGAIMEKRKMTTGEFTDSHPVLRPFAAAVERNPHMTKAFVRGFTDARLRVIQQPGNVQQLFDHFDKFYGYFFNSLLEVTHVKDEAAEHLMTHIGRANGLTNHCVMFWKKYARLGFTMLPADICADNHVNLGLLKNIPLASRDRAVRKVLFDVMCIVKDEMLHAQKIAKDVPPKAWPIVMECLYPNYYLGFLQRRDFNVSAMFADHNIENAGFTWYRIKKRWEWERHQSIERLISEAAPLPYLNTSLSHRGSQYKMASGTGVTPAAPERKKR